jgi:hypothetical protein
MNNRNPAHPHHTCSQTPSGEPRQRQGEDSGPPQLSKRTQALRAANQPALPAQQRITTRSAVHRGRARCPIVAIDVAAQKCPREQKEQMRACGGCYTVMRHGVELKNRIPPGQNVSGAIGLLGGNDNKYDGVAPFLGESWRTLASFLLQFAS